MNRFSVTVDLRKQGPDAARSLGGEVLDANGSVMNQMERGLISDIVQRDHGAMGRLYEMYHPRLHRFLAGMIRDQELIGELINDVMLTVWQKAHQFRDEARVSTWIFGISYHKALDAIRHQKRYRQVLEELPRQRDDATELRESLEQRDLDLLMRELTPEQSAVAQLTFAFGYSYPEISEILNIPVNTVKTRMFYARKVMQEKLRLGEIKR